MGTDARLGEDLSRVLSGVNSLIGGGTFLGRVLHFTLSSDEDDEDTLSLVTKRFLFANHSSPHEDSLLCLAVCLTLGGSFLTYTSRFGASGDGVRSFFLTYTSRLGSGEGVLSLL